MKRLSDRLERLLSQLEGLDRENRIRALIDTAERFRPVPSRVAVRPYPADHRVPGCESEAYVWAEPNPDGTLTFHFAVENPEGISAMALAVLLRESLSGAPLAEVASIPTDMIYRVFSKELSMGKALGLAGMVGKVRAVAQHRIGENVLQERHGA